jgi:hypothetical protein
MSSGLGTARAAEQPGDLVLLSEVVQWLVTPAGQDAALLCLMIVVWLSEGVGNPAGHMTSA